MRPSVELAPPRSHPSLPHGDAPSPPACPPRPWPSAPPPPPRWPPPAAPAGGRSGWWRRVPPAAASRRRRSRRSARPAQPGIEGEEQAGETAKAREIYAVNERVRQEFQRSLSRCAYHNYEGTKKASRLEVTELDDASCSAGCKGRRLRGTRADAHPPHLQVLHLHVLKLQRLVQAWRREGTRGVQRRVGRAWTRAHPAGERTARPRAGFALMDS